MLASNLVHLVNHAPVIIDCREASDFAKEHYADSANIPITEMFMRMQELPEKSQSLHVIFDTAQEQEVKNFFNQRQFKIEAWINWFELKQQLKQQQLEQKICHGLSDKYYWQPAPFIQYFFEHFLSNSSQSKTVLDAACGSGRDAIFLAMQGYSVYAIDYSATALERCTLSAKNRRVEISTRQVDLETSFDLEALSGWPKKFDVIMVCRYLHRPLLPLLAKLLKPKGFIAYHTFLIGSEKIGSPRNPDFLLKPGELSDCYSEFTILCDQVVPLADGRPMSYFIAQNN